MTRFEVWAPGRQRVRLWLSGTEHSMTPRPGGWWSLDVPDADHGVDYGFLLDDADPTVDPADDDDTDSDASGDPADPARHPADHSADGTAEDTADDAAGEVDTARPARADGILPDPRSLWQPYGVHRPSRTYHHGRFTWHDSDWTGRALPGSVLYELHIGSFTPQGTFDAAIERLDHLVDLGIDLVEVLPVAAFNGDRGWGYDGVAWYAVHEPYGGPDGFKRFVDACHVRGLGVVLDVVYNHFGPSGAHLRKFAPYLTKGETGWGRQVNLDGPGSDEVRRYIIDNACGWLRDYHLDGLRLDAVHALSDSRAVHLLEELSAAVDTLATHLGRPLSLIAESDRNDPRLITPREAGGLGLHGVWDDDIHHAVHAALTGERQGYYVDFGSLDTLAKALTKAYVHDGGYSTFRGRSHGRPVDVATTPGYRFVAYSQNHDQVGNRAAGDRLSATLSPGLLKLAATLILTSPYTPMLFMGEEWAASTPWQYFSSHPEPKLARAVTQGRRREFAAHGWSSEALPDPQDSQTLERSTLDWAEVSRSPHCEVLDCYRELISLRRRHSDLSDPRLDRVAVRHGERWLAVRRGRFAVIANLAPSRVEIPIGSAVDGDAGAAATLHFATDPGVRIDGDAIRLGAQSAAIVAFDHHGV